MRCPYCQCRALSPLSSKRWLCIECEAVLSEADAFSDYDTGGISGGAFAAILIGIMCAVLLIKLFG